MDAILPVDVLSEGISEPDREFRQEYRKLSIGLILALYVTFGHENFVKGPAGFEIGWTPDSDCHDLRSTG